MLGVMRIAAQPVRVAGKGQPPAPRALARVARLCGGILALSLTVSGSGARAAQPETSAADPALVALYKEFRAFVAPARKQGVPDYSEAAMHAKREGLREFQRRLAAIDTSGWDIPRRVDYAVVHTEMTAMEFQHRVLQPWKKDPAFYAVVNFQFGPKIHGSPELPEFPAAKDKVGELDAWLSAVPAILDQARGNLTDARADLALLGIRTKETEHRLLTEVLPAIRRHHPELVPATEAAIAAVDSFRDWLIENRATMKGPSGIGEEECDWYLRHVLLLPYTWRDMKAIADREYQRALALMRIEEHRNRKLPPMRVVDNLEDWNALITEARETITGFVQKEQIMTLPELAPRKLSTRFVRPEPRDYFEQVLDRDPVPLLPHSFLGHFPDEIRQEKDPRPFRGGSRLFFIDAIRAEALATGMEQMLMHAGILDDRPRSRELGHNLWAFRAARSVADLKMQSNEFSIGEAFQYVIDKTPRGWVPPDSPTLWHDLELYLRQPLYGIGYMIGLIQIERLLGEYADKLGDEFTMAGFLDTFIAKGMIPIELIRWEMTGNEEFIRGVIPAAVAGKQAAVPARPSAMLDSLLEEVRAFEKKENPLPLPRGTDPRYRDRLPVATAEHFLREAKVLRGFLERLDALDPSRFDRPHLMDAAVLRLRLEYQLAKLDFRSYLVPVHAGGGFHVAIAKMPDELPFDTIAHYDTYIARLQSVREHTAQQIALMRAGLKEGLTLPREVLDGHDLTIAPLLADTPRQSLFWRPFEKLPAAIDDAGRARVLRDGEAAIRDSVLPALRDFRAFMRDEYTPGARATVGLSALPGGLEHYRERIRFFTTLDLTPEQLHETGLQEVGRIRGEMNELIERAGFKGTLAEFIQSLRDDPRHYVNEPAQLLKEAAWVAKQMDAKLPQFFLDETLPRTPYGVKPMPALTAPRATGAYYDIGKPGCRAGNFTLNTSELGSRPLYTLEALTFHEAVPGHHLQIMIQREAPRISGFRRTVGLPAFEEGWALYAETLGREAGFFADPHSDFGRLSYEMWRACRLVVDTGIHALGWTRQQSIDYLAQNTSLSMHEVRTETDRYISGPGQALAYKTGELFILKLRHKAEQELGEAFDLRAFHHALLRNGSLPLPLVEEEVDRFIADTRAAR